MAVAKRIAGYREGMVLSHQARNVAATHRRRLRWSRFAAVLGCATMLTAVPTLMWAHGTGVNSDAALRGSVAGFSEMPAWVQRSAVGHAGSHGAAGVRTAASIDEAANHAAGMAAASGENGFAPGAEVGVETPASADTVTVRRGETLWGLAERYAPANEDPRRWIHDTKVLNHLATSMLQPGEQLQLP